MSLKTANNSFHYLKLLEKDQFLDASYYVELPIKDDFKVNLENCILAYYYYSASNPTSERKYKLFKHYETLTEVDIEDEVVELGKVNVILIFLNISSIRSVELLKILKNKYITD